MLLLRDYSVPGGRVFSIARVGNASFLSRQGHFLIIAGYLPTGKTIFMTTPFTPSSHETGIGSLRVVTRRQETHRLELKSNEKFPFASVVVETS